METIVQNIQPQQEQKQESTKLCPSLLVIFLLIVAVAAVSVGGTYYYLLPQIHSSSSKQPPSYQPITHQPLSQSITPQENPISENTQIPGWKTYTDNKYGYSFQYPPSWYLQPIDYKQQTDPTSLEQVFISEHNDALVTKQGYVLTVQYNLTPLPLQKAATFSKKKSVRVDGHDFKKVYVSSTPNNGKYFNIEIEDNNSPSVTLLPYIDGMYMMISFENPASDYGSGIRPAELPLADSIAQKYDALFDQMLSTFRFNKKS